MNRDSVREALQAAPPVSVGGLTLWGAPLSEWVLLLTAIYTVFLIVDKLPCIYRRVRQLFYWLMGESDEQQGSK